MPSFPKFYSYDPDVTALNSYSGGNLQQSSSALTETNPNAYEILPNGEKVSQILSPR